jgi:hypothetical protein
MQARVGGFSRSTPRVPLLVEVVEVGHVGQPHLRGQQLRLARPHLGEQLIDAGEHPPGLGSDVRSRIARIVGDPGKMDDIAARDGPADDRGKRLRLAIRSDHDAVASDLHPVILGHPSVPLYATWLDAVDPITDCAGSAAGPLLGHDVIDNEGPGIWR